MIVSEVEIDTPEEWLEVLIELEEKVEVMNIVQDKNWYIKSGMCKHNNVTKKEWYVQVLVKDHDQKDL